MNQTITLADLYDDFEDALRGYAQRLTQDGDRTDDLVQEAFIRAMKHLELLQLLKHHQRRAWLHQTLKHLFLDEVAAHKRRETLVEQIGQVMPTMGYLPQSLELPNPFKLVPEAYREVFDKRYRLGMNSQEIAAELGIPAATVRSRLHLGMKKLRSQQSKLR